MNLFEREEVLMLDSYQRGRSYILGQIKKNGEITARDIVTAVTTYGFPKEMI